jgi:hypothetical protein
MNTLSSPGSLTGLCLVLAGTGLAASDSKVGIERNWTDDEIHAAWTGGETLPWNAVKRYPIAPLKLKQDTGINVLIDLANYNVAQWGKGANWQKEWYLFQKLDDRYGPQWYPRWRWVQHTRWKEDPTHDLTWEEMVEDMSIAVGEDLFPFFLKAGTSLKKERLESIEFQGTVLSLPVAPIDHTPAGPVRIEAIGDPTIPLRLDRPAANARQTPGIVQPETPGLVHSPQPHSL